MMRKFILTFSMLLFFASAGAQDRGSVLHAGVDWGGGLTFAETHHYNYITHVGYRVDDRDGSAPNRFTGHVTGYVGAWAYDNVSLALHAGWAGLENGKRMVPAFVRTDWYFGAPKKEDCFFMYFDIGTDILSLDRNALLAGIGTGRRIVLYKGLGVDFHLSLRTLQCRPVLIDEDTMLPVPEDDVRDNSLAYYGLEFGIRLGF